jgi:periplasmic divalent cation tolerance protein
MGEAAFFYITNPSKEEAQKLAKHLLEKRLIAGANIFPVESMYWWDGKIAEEAEYALLAKTLDEKTKALEDEVKKMHPYTVPCIVKISVSSNKDFFEWIKGEVKK